VAGRLFKRFARRRAIERILAGRIGMGWDSG